MTKREAVKMLKMEKEIVSLNAEAHAIFAVLALELLYKGQEVKAKLVAGSWKK